MRLFCNWLCGGELSAYRAFVFLSICILLLVGFTVAVVVENYLFLSVLSTYTFNTFFNNETIQLRDTKECILYSFPLTSTELISVPSSAILLFTVDKPLP